MRCYHGSVASGRINPGKSYWLSNPCLLFADDTEIYNHIESEDYMYVNCSRILLNLKSGLKCGRCFLTFPRTKVYTWAQIDNHLRFHNILSTAISKARRFLGLISKSFINLSPQIFSLLYKTIVRLCLEYGNIIWGPNYKVDED